MKRYLGVWLALALALLVAACSNLQAAPQAEPTSTEPTFTYSWDGKRGLGSEKCEYAGQPGRPATGWIHWVFNTKGASTGAELTLGGTGSGTYEPGEPLDANIWHFYTPYYDLSGLTATITLFGGDKGPGSGLVISDWCAGTGSRSLQVSKTADTEFTRTHKWKIAKSVATDYGYTYNGYPKIWLYTDGRGDETATWTVDVTYNGYEDSGFAIYGAITIKNIATTTKTIDSVTDDLGLEKFEGIDLTCKVGDDVVTFPYALGAGQTITCTYREAVTAEAGDRGTNVVTVVVNGEEDPYYGEAEWAFDAPTTEVNKSVHVWDYNDLSDPLDWINLGKVTAPEGTRFTYSKAFAWADYGKDNCGDFAYHNIAKVIGDENAVLGEARATLKVNVQCFVFKGETVTGAGLPWSRVRGAPNTWFEYTPQNFAADVLYDLIQGRPRNKVGTFEINAVNGQNNLCFTFGEFPAGTPWELDSSKTANVKIQPLDAAPTRYLQPGQFAYHFTLTGTSFCVTVPQVKYGYAIHLDAGYWMPDPNFGP